MVVGEEPGLRQVYADRWLAAIREKILSLDTLPEAHATPAFPSP